MGFAFPLMALPVVAGLLDDVMVDWAETRDVRAEKAKKRAEVKRISTIESVDWDGWMDRWMDGLMKWIVKEGLWRHC